VKAKVTKLSGLSAVDSWESPLIKVVNGRRIVPCGTIIDQNEHPETNCVKLVQMGEGVPVDDECWKACGMSPIQVTAAQSAREKLYSISEPDEQEEDQEDSDE